MKNLYKIGQIIYLAAIAELAVYSFFKGDFAMTRPRPLPEALQFINPIFAYVTGALLLLSVAAVCLNRYRKEGLLTIASIVFLGATSRHFFLNLWADHINGFKTLWLIGGALLILTKLPDYEKYEKSVLWANLVVLCLFFVDCGLAHFGFADFVEKLIPTFIPFRSTLPHLTGVCLVLGGFGLLIPKVQRLAALLSGIQVAGWFVLLHIPRAITLMGDEWIGVGESLAVSGVCFMVCQILKSENAISL